MDIAKWWLLLRSFLSALFSTNFWLAYRWERSEAGLSLVWWCRFVRRLNALATLNGDALHSTHRFVSDSAGLCYHIRGPCLRTSLGKHYGMAFSDTGPAFMYSDVLSRLCNMSLWRRVSRTICSPIKVDGFSHTCDHFSYQPVIFTYFYSRCFPHASHLHVFALLFFKFNTIE